MFVVHHDCAPWHVFCVGVGMHSVHCWLISSLHVMMLWAGEEVSVTLHFLCVVCAIPHLLTSHISLSLPAISILYLSIPLFLSLSLSTPSACSESSVLHVQSLSISLTTSSTFWMTSPTTSTSPHHPSPHFLLSHTPPILPKFPPPPPHRPTTPGRPICVSCERDKSSSRNRGCCSSLSMSSSRLGKSVARGTLRLAYGSTTTCMHCSRP